MNKNQKLLADTERPICPVCGNRLSFWQIEGDMSTNYYWYCSCITRLKERVDQGTLLPDIVTYA